MCVMVEEDLMMESLEDIIWESVSFYEEICPCTFFGKKVISYKEFYILMKKDQSLYQFIKELLALPKVSKLRNIKLYLLVFFHKIRETGNGQ